jgi:hypothetical protein
MNIKQVKKLEKEVFEGAFAIVADIQATIREVAENWTACSCCGEPTELVELAGSTEGLRVLLVNAVVAALTEATDDDVVGLKDIFGSAKGLNAFRVRLSGVQFLKDNPEVDAEIEAQILSGK